MHKAKSKRRAKRESRSTPVEIGPGIFSQDYGRWNFIQSNRTPEQQSALIGVTREFRQNFPKRIAEKVAELERILAKYDSFDLLANLTRGRLFINPETYKETTHDHGDAAVEYATLLCLKRTYSTGIEPLTMEAYADVVQRLDEIIWTTIWFYSAEGIGELAHKSRLDSLRRDTITAELLMRNPGYPHHLAQTLLALFQPFDPWLLKSVGFTIGDLLSIEKAVWKLINKRFVNGRNLVRAFEKKFQAEFEEFKKSGAVASENHRKYFETLQTLKPFQARRAIVNLHATTFFSRLGAEFSFTAKDLSEASGVPPERVTAGLDLFSLTFGSVPSDFLWPRPNHALKQKPFIRHEDLFMCPNAKLFLWAIRPMLERLLNPEAKISSVATKDSWTKYSDKRADFLERESLRLLSSTLRRTKVYQNLNFESNNGRQIKPRELDGLVIFDKTLILVEAKAGNFPLKARAGFRDAICENLKKLVAEAHEQVLEARKFLEGTDKPIFTLTDGSQLLIEKSQFERVFMIVVTLEPLDVFCANLHQTADLGLFPSGELPWVIQLSDLQVIAEAIEFPSQLVHYLQRRLRVNRIKKLEASDDLDWFGCYLSDGLIFDRYEQTNLDLVRLASFTADFDDYYFYEQGVRKTPAKMPRQKMPDLFRKIVLGIDASGIKGCSEAVCLLLDFDEIVKQKFAETLERQLSEAERFGTINSFSTKIPQAKFGATCVVCPPDRVQEASFDFGSFVQLMKYNANADKWVGVFCVSGQGQPVGSWFLIDATWKQDAALEAELKDLRMKRSSQWQW